MQHRPSLRALTVLPLVVAAACVGASDVSGRVGATQLGDVSNAPAERVAARAPLSDACGPPATPVSAQYAFARSPYLQRVSANAADLVWVSAADPALQVLVSSPSGAPVAQPTAAPDESALVAEGDRQWVAPLEGLSPDTLYCYELRDESGTAARAGFHTAPASGSNKPVRFVAFGDSGEVNEDQDTLLDQMRTVPFDFMVHTGDIAYESGTREELDRTFFQVYRELLGDYPIFPSSGNHEYETEDAAPFREAFDLPRNGGPDGTERWYSFDWGDVHFVALDTELIGSVQARWLEEDLARNERPWTIVYGHRPPFSSGYHGSDGGFRTTFGPILEKHQVDLVLSGHDHHYERTKPQNGVTYVVTGGGGRGVKDVAWSDFTAFNQPVIHFVYVTVDGGQLALHAIDGLGQEFDSLVLRSRSGG
jgi:acid phosphatase type 7